MTPCPHCDPPPHGPMATLQRLKTTLPTAADLACGPHRHYRHGSWFCSTHGPASVCIRRAWAGASSLRIMLTPQALPYLAMQGAQWTLPPSCLPGTSSCHTYATGALRRDHCPAEKHSLFRPLERPLLPAWGTSCGSPWLLYTDKQKPCLIFW
jgi:hypothetical protein